MKKFLIIGAAVVALGAVVPAHAYLGDVYTLYPDHREGGGWTVYTGEGLNGTDAYGAIGADGVRRIYWELSGPGLPSTPEQFTIEIWDPAVGGNGWQPIQGVLNGSAGDQFPIEPGIPWQGQFGTNGQWIGSEGSPNTAGQWVATGPGPQAPVDASPTSPGNGDRMWLKDGSWLYAKWDFGWDIDRTWSAIRLTQVSGVVPEPGSFVALGAGLASMAGMLLRRKS